MVLKKNKRTGSLLLDICTALQPQDGGSQRVQGSENSHRGKNTVYDNTPRGKNRIT